MLAIDLKSFHKLSLDDQKIFLVTFAQNYFASQGKAPQLQQFETVGLSRQIFRRHFENFQSFLKCCNLPTKQRKVNLSLEEMKQ